MSQSARIIVRDETGEERSFLAMSAGYPDAVGEVIAKYLREDGPEYTPNRAANEVAGDLFRLVSEAVGPDEVWFDMPNFGASYTYFIVQDDTWHIAEAWDGEPEFGEKQMSDTRKPVGDGEVVVRLTRKEAQEMADLAELAFEETSWGLAAPAPRVRTPLGDKLRAALDQEAA